MIWLTRGKTPKLNRDSGQIATGDYTALAEGPDGISNSAMRFDGTDALVVKCNRALDGNFTAQFGFKLPTSPTSIPPDTYPPDVSEWENMDQIGTATTFIAVNMTKARFEFVISGVARAWLDAAGWQASDPGDAADITEAGPYFDQDRSAWVFWLDGAVAGTLDGNNQSDNFLNALPSTYNPTLFAYINFNDEDERIEFWTMTTADAAPRITGYIDATSTHNGAPA